MQQSQPSAPPPEYARRDPASVTPSTLLGSSRTPSQSNPQNIRSQPQIQTQSLPHTSSQESQTSEPPTSTTTTPSYARPPSPTPSTQTTASTILPTYAETGSYKGFPSEAAYIAALTEWAEQKKYVQPSEEAQTLSGFFGYKTIEEYTGGLDRKQGEGGNGRRGSRKQSQDGGDRGGVMGFLKRMAKKDEGGGHGDS